MVDPRSYVASGAYAVEINKVLRNTYVLLGAMIAFAALVSFFSIALGAGSINIIVYFIGFFGLSYVVNKTANSSWGIFWSFVFAGFLGYAFSWLIGYYLFKAPLLVAQALGLTAATFFALSAYTVVKQKDFSWLQQFLFVSFFVILGIFVLALFFDLSFFSAVISAFCVIVASALILWQTSAIVLGGERNYVIAANNLFVAIYLLFVHLLSLLGIMSDD